MVMTRARVAATPAWTNNLQWYARAVALMRQRPANDPTSWTYQASIHGTDTTPARTAWNSCQHGGWYFLAWHRGYLYYFERIVRAAVVSAGGPSDWALPYWDYENPQTRALPRAFREATLPGGGTNPLRATARDPQVNRGSRLTVSSAQARALTSFSTGPMRGFGGSVTPSSFQANGPGKLELNPHGDVHVIVGGGGWMSRFQTAALDPIFWLHHCNLDRIWSEWARNNANPTAASWLNQSFTFFDENGTTVAITPAGVIDTVAALNYTYDTLPVPVGAAAGTATTAGGTRGQPTRGEPIPAMVGMSAPGSTDVRSTGGGNGGGFGAASGSSNGGASNGGASNGGSTAEPQLVGASATPVVLRGDAARVGVAVDAATASRVAPSAAARTRGGPTSPNRLYLQLDDIAADAAPNVVYAVYMSAPGAGGSPQEHQIGTVSFFGADVQATSTEEAHPLHYVFDVTETMPLLADARGGLPQGVEVVFRPLTLDPPDEDDVTDVQDAPLERGASTGVNSAPATMRVGRVALFAAPPE
ncbi:MAG: hypothetical protein QOJ19_1213 [Acidimicrobiia bacterium]|jgi:tyrosinase|nr:hypothetical protein [Acidimicrobiia bacterium]